MASSSDPRLDFAYGEHGEAFGAFAAHIGGILGRGEQDVLSRMPTCVVARFGRLRLQESPFAHVGMEAPHPAVLGRRLREIFLGPPAPRPSWSASPFRPWQDEKRLGKLPPRLWGLSKSGNYWVRPAVAGGRR